MVADLSSNDSFKRSSSHRRYASLVGLASIYCHKWAAWGVGYRCAHCYVAVNRGLRAFEHEARASAADLSLLFVAGR